jgi:hypothetical protein
MTTPDTERAPGEGRHEEHNRHHESSAVRRSWQAYLDHLDPLGIGRAVLLALAVFGLTAAWSWR